MLTAWDQGQVVGYYTGLPLVIDGYFEFAHELEARNDAAKKVLASSKCSDVTQALDAFRARYLYMARDELYGGNAMYGILELENCPGVHLIFSSDGARVYERVGSPAA